MNKLDYALAWAARGFPVFPLEVAGKRPMHDDWPSVATTDPDVIRSMWTSAVMGGVKDYNIGMLCSDMVVIDIDVKLGKNGLAEYEALGGDYDTLVVRTPSGGYHCYFVGPDSSNASLSNAVDVRSHNGYVVAPGSWTEYIEGKQAEGWYQVVTDKEPSYIPFSLEAKLQPPYTRAAGSADVSIDSEAAIQTARDFLATTPVAIEGARGDETTFITAARLVRELALSPDVAFELLWEHWNPRCIPPWDWDELYQKVQNAAEYGSADAGRLDPSLIYAGVEIPPPPSVYQQAGLSFGNALAAQDIKPRPWIMDRLLMLHETTLLLAPGSAGKSSLALALAAHLAVGKDFGPYKVHVKCRSILYNGEDGIEEQSRRLRAVCSAYGFNFDEVRREVLLLSADELSLVFMGSEGRRPVVQEATVQQFVQLASDPSVGLVVFDPLVDIHEVDEGDNPMMNAVMKVLKRIAREANVACLTLHHSTKGGNAKQEDRVGNMDISRGASGIVYKARIAFTLLNATDTDCMDYGLQATERNAWVRLDDAKMNLSLAGAEAAAWFKREGVRIESGDTVGALKLHDLRKDTTNVRLLIADVLLATMQANGQASMTVPQAVAVVKQGFPLWQKDTDASVKGKLEGMFAIKLEVRGMGLQFVRDPANAKVSAMLVMT